MNITFRVPSLPVAQPRAKATTVNGMARMYEASSKHGIHTFKASVKMMAHQTYQGPPLEGPLSARLTFVFASKKKERVYKITRPDNDNLAKGVLDALNGLLFKDDSQVCELVVRKWHAGKDEQPHVMIEIQEVNQ